MPILVLITNSTAQCYSRKPLSDTIDCHVDATSHMKMLSPCGTASVQVQGSPHFPVFTAVHLRWGSLASESEMRSLCDRPQKENFRRVQKDMGGKESRGCI